MGGTLSARFARPRRVDPVDPFTESGNSDRRGVIAATTFLADLRSVSLIVHSRFLAMKKRVAVVTVGYQH